jgi:hypothetical protein
VLIRIHLDQLVAITAIEKIVGFDEVLQLGGVSGVSCDDKHERLDDFTIGFPRVGFKLLLGLLVKEADAVREFQLLDGPLLIPAGLKFLGVITAGSLTNPSAIARPSAQSYAATHEDWWF